ncbi:MAG: SRPBCC family protein [Deltaproteobacteria bacterium]|nr:SRPBCC family protein [Deltaproteobacteria bacterium]MBW2418338.1 SRPBCC family protein [Deltaproteobacteria bacterium]
MGSIAIEEEIAASADAAWKSIGDFAGIGGWMPGIDSCDTEGEGIGAVRTVNMGALKIVEKLEAHDDDARSISYSITEGPLPVQNYLATIQVSDAGAGCKVDWTARFDLPEGVEEAAIAPALEGAYGGALKALKAQLENA